MADFTGPYSGYEAVLRADGRAALLEDLRRFDSAAVRGWSDARLAEWQANYPPDSPQWRLAEHEWAARLMRGQIRATRRETLLSAGLGFLGGIAASAVSVLLTALLNGWRLW